MAMYYERLMSLTEGMEKYAGYSEMEKRAWLKGLSRRIGLWMNKQYVKDIKEFDDEIARAVAAQKELEPVYGKTFRAYYTDKPALEEAKSLFDWRKGEVANGRVLPPGTLEQLEKDIINKRLAFEESEKAFTPVQKEWNKLLRQERDARAMRDAVDSAAIKSGQRVLGLSGLGVGGLGAGTYAVLSGDDTNAGAGVK